MKSNLLVYFPIGPTFRFRSVRNILDNVEAYSNVDVLIMTDYKEDPVFNSLMGFKNVMIKDIDELRKDYQWSIEHEPLPIKTLSESEYARDITRSNRKISSSIWRFAFLLESIEDYHTICVCNCDVVWQGDKQNVEDMVSYISSFDEDLSIGHGYYDYTDGIYYDVSFQKTAEQMAVENNSALLTSKLTSNDGNLFCYHFKNKSSIKRFLELSNNIVYEVLVNKRSDLRSLGYHSIWMVNNELIQAIVHSMLNINVYPIDGPLHSSFSIRTYPQDRFWNWFTGDFEVNTESKESFIKTNYERLKDSYPLTEETIIN